jgi:hypothetical protein
MLELRNTGDGVSGESLGSEGGEGCALLRRQSLLGAGSLELHTKAQLAVRAPLQDCKVGRTLGGALELRQTVVARTACEPLAAVVPICDDTGAPLPQLFDARPVQTGFRTPIQHMSRGEPRVAAIYNFHGSRPGEEKFGASHTVGGSVTHCRSA